MQEILNHRQRLRSVSGHGNGNGTNGTNTSSNANANANGGAAASSRYCNRDYENASVSPNATPVRSRSRTHNHNNPSSPFRNDYSRSQYSHPSYPHPHHQGSREEEKYTTQSEIGLSSITAHYGTTTTTTSSSHHHHQDQDHHPYHLHHPKAHSVIEGGVSVVVGVRTSTGGSAAAAAGIGGGGGSGWNVKDLANRLNHRAGARTNHSFRPSWVKKNSPSHSHSHSHNNSSGSGGGGEGAESKESIEQEDPPRSNRSSNEHSHSSDETKSIPISMQERTTTASAPNMEQPTTKAISSSSSTEGKTHFWRSQTKASQSPQHNHANVDVSSTPCDRHRRVSVSPRRARLRGYKSELGGEGPPPPPPAAAGSTSISKSSGLSGSDSLTHKVHHVTQNQIRPTSLSPSRQRFGTRIQCGGGSGGEGEGTTEATFAKSAHSAGERKARNVNINGNGRATSPIRQRLWKAKFDTKVEKEDPAGDRDRDRDRDAGKDRGQAESQPPVREQEEQGPMNTNTNTNTKIQSFQSRIAQFSRGESAAAPATATATATAPATARASTGHESHGPSRSSFPKRSVETKVRSPAAGSGSNKGDMAPEGQGHVAHRPHQQLQQHHQQSQQPSQQRPIATEEEPTDPNPNGAAGGGDASEKFHFWKNQMNQRSRTNSVGIAKDGPVPPPVPVHSQSQPQPPRDSSDSRRMEGGSSKVVAHPHITTSRSETTEGMKRVHGANAVQQSQQSQQPKSGAGAGGGAAGGGVSQKAQFWLSQQHKKKQDADLASGKVRLKVHHVTPSSASSAPGSKDYSFPPPPPPQQQQQKSEDEAPSKASNGDLVTPPRSHANVSRGVAGGIGIGRTFSPTQSPKGTVSSAKSQPVQTKEEGSGQGTPIATGSGTPQNTSTSSGEYKTQYMQYMTSKNRRNAPQAELSFASNDDSNEMNAEQEEEFRRSMAKISERRGKVKRSWPPTSTPSNDEVDGVVVGEGRGEGFYESPMRETGRENAAQESPAFRIDSSRGNQMDSRDNTPKAQWNKTMERNATCASDKDKVHDARRNSHERYGRREVDIAHEGLNDRGPSFPNSTQSYNKHKSIGKSGSGKQPMNYHSEQRQSTAQAEEEGETSQSKVIKFKQYNRVAKNHNFTTPPPPPQDSLKKGDNTNLSMTPSRSTATTVISTDESQHMSNPWSTPQRQPVTYIMKDTGTPIKEEPEDDCHDTSTVITDTSSFLPVSEVKKKLWDDGEHLKQWRSDRAPIASEQPKPVEDEAQASLFKSRYYRAAEVAQQNCAKHNTLPSQPPNQYQLRQHSDAGVSKKQISSNAKSTLLSGRENRYYRAAEVAQKSSSDFQGQQVDDEPNYQGRKRHVDPAQKPLFSRDGTRERPNPLAATAEAMSDELRKGDKSVQQLLAKLRSVQRDDPNTALEKIDSIIESESNSMEHDEGKADAMNESNEFPSEQPVEIDQNTVSDESGSSEYDSDDSTVSSITNPTYMSGFGDSFSYSRRQQFSQLVAKDGRLSPPYHSTRPSSFLTKPRQNDEGKARTPELPPRQPRQSSRNTTPLKGNHSTPNDPKARSVKSSVRPLAKSRNKTKPQLKSSISHPGSQPRSHDSDYIKPKSPIKSFAAKGNSINNRGLLNKFNTWGEDSSQEGEEVNAYDDHGGQSNVGSPNSERLKRLAEKITDKDSADHISKSGQNLLQSNRPRRFLYPQRSDSNEEHPVDTAGTEGGASWEPSSFFGTDFFEKDQTHENRTKREHFFKDGNNEFGSFRNNAFATKQLERKFSQVEKAYETNSPIF